MLPNAAQLLARPPFMPGIVADVAPNKGFAVDSGLVQWASFAVAVAIAWGCWSGKRRNPEHVAEAVFVAGASLTMLNIPVYSVQAVGVIGGAAYAATLNPKLTSRLSSAARRALRRARRVRD